jgi:hypothetical protein
LLLTRVDDAHREKVHGVFLGETEKQLIRQPVLEPLAALLLRALSVARPAVVA